jgi:hypothetical protein
MEFLTAGTASGLNRNALADCVYPPGQCEGVDAGQLTGRPRVVEPAGQLLQP